MNLGSLAPLSLRMPERYAEAIPHVHEIPIVFLRQLEHCHWITQQHEQGYEIEVHMSSLEKN